MGRSRLPARMAHLVFGGVFFTVGLLFISRGMRGRIRANQGAE